MTKSGVYPFTMISFCLNFVGPAICSAFMQAVGVVKDHLTDCFCYEEITNLQTSG